MAEQKAAKQKQLAGEAAGAAGRQPGDQGAKVDK